MNNKLDGLSMDLENANNEKILYCFSKYECTAFAIDMDALSRSFTRR